MYKSMMATVTLLIALLSVSAYDWRLLIARRWRGQPLLEQHNEPRAGWRSIPELIGVYVALLWLIYHLLPYFWGSTNTTPASISLESVAVAAVVNIGLCVVLPLLLISGQQPLSAFGITARNLGTQTWINWQGFSRPSCRWRCRCLSRCRFATLNASTLCSNCWRIRPTADDRRDRRHRRPVCLVTRGVVGSRHSTGMDDRVRSSIGGESTGGEGVFVHCISAAEPATLLPLALLLGYVFDRRHSYVSVVMIHALFNATMLVFQLLNPQLP